MKSAINILILIIIFALNLSAQSENSTIIKYDVFSFQKEVVLPGTPEEIFDVVTGDISGWWDHSFSENPKKFFIEPKVGGGFIEYFDDKGSGVLHAIVTGVERGKMLRFVGPLGLAGTAINMVHTYSFAAMGSDSTLFKVDVHASGEMEEGTAAIVESVWEHFIFEQLKPYVDAGNLLKK